MKKNILVAPLNWGLGHAGRCIPIIKALEENGFTPVIASDGASLEILRLEFPHLKALQLPSYHVAYPKKGAHFKWKMLQNMPRIISAIRQEKKITDHLIQELNLNGIISDNRPGIFSRKVPSVYMTHQLNVLSGNTTWLSSLLHRLAIRKFDECWIPDWEDKPNLSGILGHLKKPPFKIRYIGPLSRFEKSDAPMKYDLMVLLSGPEPQRSILEDLLLKIISAFKGEVVFVSGKMEKVQNRRQEENITFYNYMTTAELQKTFNESHLVVCRSGYSTIMDLVKLKKHAFLIPTPGQYEQEYLAKKWKKDGIFSFARQDNFKLDNLIETDLYHSFPQKKSPIDWKELFCLFQSK